MTVFKYDYVCFKFLCFQLSADFNTIFAVISDAGTPTLIFSGFVALDNATYTCPWLYTDL